MYLLVAGYAALGRLKEAAGVMQKLVAEHDADIGIASFPLIILCEIYQQLDDWDEIIHVVAHFNITNVDDGTLVLRSYQAAAMANNGLTDAALEVLKDCLRSTKRNLGLLHESSRRGGQLTNLHIEGCVSRWKLVLVQQVVLMRVVGRGHDRFEVLDRRI